MEHCWVFHILGLIWMRVLKFYIGKNGGEMILFQFFQLLYYSYELQLEPAVQRKGLGKFMMQILELVAFRNNMRKVILTILKNNHYSKFFKALK